MATPAFRPLADVHAIMDDVDTLQAARATAVDPAQLTRQVIDTYHGLGLDVDPALVAQAVESRLSPTTALVRPAAGPFDFGWKRPRSLTEWETRLGRRQKVTQAWTKFLSVTSSLAFFGWLWMVLGSVPPAWDHPWLFAFACMGTGSVIEGYIKQRQHTDKKLDVVAKSPAAKTVASWQRSPRALAYLEAMIVSDVPLLKADVARLKDRAKHDERMALVRQGVSAG